MHAEGCYRERRQRQAVLERDAKLGRFVRERLLEGWTPERIAGWLNDRVWRQACFQAVPVRSMALSVTTSLRMQAVSASFAGFPARRSRR